MRFSIKLILFIVIFFTGCTSVQIVEKTQNTGISRYEVTNEKKEELKLEKEEIIEREENETTNFIEVYDPLSPINRRIYTFNYYLDKYFLIPTVKTYDFILPDFMKKSVSNFFSNLGEINNFTNALLQLKIERMVISFLRFGINSTLGIFGLIDVASIINLKKAHEDFGLTLARYGVGAGPYLVVPGLGPMNLRDGVGKVVDTLTLSFINPFNSLVGLDTNHYGVMATKFIDARKQHEDFRYYGTGSPFEYEYVRYLITKYREIQVNSNNKSKDIINDIKSVLE